jgi:uncharacterized membrane protein YbhN (UPF0104 family)
VIPRIRAAFVWLEEKPVIIVVIAAGATVGVALVLASAAGWPHVLRVAYARHSWSWLLICLAGELVAYGGYVLTVRDVARLHGGEMSLSASLETVVAGFGVFAATRLSGGFAVDYWAFRRAGAGRRDAATRVLGLEFLEYVVLSVGVLLASLALYLGIDGHASDGITLPSLLLIPVLAIGLFLTSPKRAERLSKRGKGRLRRWFADGIVGAVNVRDLLLSPRTHGLGVLGNALYWAGDLLCLWAALQLVHAQISVAALVLAYSGGYVVTRRALPAGGAGLVELALTFALVGMDVHFAKALLAVIVYRLFNFWLPIIPALLLMPGIKELRAEFRRA